MESPEEAHKHLVVAGTVEARLVGDNLVALIVVAVLIVAPWHMDYQRVLYSDEGM